MGKIINLGNDGIIYIKFPKDNIKDVINEFCLEIKTYYYPSLDDPAYRPNTMLEFENFPIRTMTSLENRNIIAEVIRPLAKIDSKIALVGNNSVTKIVIEFIFTIANLTDDVQIFTTTETALAWLNSQD